MDYSGAQPADDETDWLQRLNSMLPTIAKWAERTRSAPSTPVPGSSLARDDELFPPQPASHVAYAAIVTATEHLDLFRVAFQASRALFPSGYFTLLRTALMGAAQAIWVLKGPRPQRQENALRIVRDDIKQRHGLLTVDVPEALGLGERIEEERERLQRQLREVQAAAAHLGFNAKAVNGWRLNMTQVIKTASELVHGNGQGDEATRYGTSLLWRLQSGHAHGTPSMRIMQVERTEVTAHDDGTLFGKATTTAVDVGAAAAASLLMLNDAWRLYDLRCQPA
ncbi:hypothetical protein [Prauserella muralis]|uniref:Uncharacterized protein n=1 Tax=Prauserella muralis TaxID=588067 RepID=A0A2V4ADN7_9PSEU|nr:hypothetical protein [Prauserella muralis]PXY16610.1 hypothetical protein BAY60_36075 [Prauserella muralis]TWE11141.1 hypothetical protein FHX69_7360 [Prauserella muralis]